MNKESVSELINNIWFKDFVSINRVFEKQENLEKYSVRIINQANQANTRELLSIYDFDYTQIINDALLSEIIKGINKSFFDLMFKTQEYSEIVQLDNRIFNERFYFSNKIKKIKLNDFISQIPRHKRAFMFVSQEIFYALCHELDCFYNIKSNNRYDIYKTVNENIEIFQSTCIKNSESFLMLDSDINFSFFLDDDFFSSKDSFNTLEIYYKFKKNKTKIKKILIS